jgi:uncharacterized protein involved in exopolysaccharide biosynthesis
MAPQSPDHSSSELVDPDRIDLSVASAAFRAFAEWCVRHWVRYLLVLPVFIGLSLLHSTFAEPGYQAVVKVLPYRGGQTDLGGLSGLAGLAGISLPAGRQGPVVSTEAYPEITASFSFRSRLLRERIHFSTGEETLSAWLNRTTRSWWSEEEATGSSTAADSSVTDSPAPISAKGGRPVPVRVPLSFMQQVRWVGARVRTSVDRKTGIVTTEARMPDPVAAADLAQAASDLLTHDLMAYETRRADEQARFLQQQYSQANLRYRSAQLAVARFQDNNRVIGSAVTSAELTRLQRELNVAEELLRSVTAQLESARVRQQEDTPLIAMLEPAVVPARASWPRPALSLAVMVLLGGLSTTLWLYIGFRTERAKHTKAAA